MVCTRCGAAPLAEVLLAWKKTKLDLSFLLSELQGPTYLVVVSVGLQFWPCGVIFSSLCSCSVF